MFEKLFIDAIRASGPAAVHAFNRLESACCARRLMAMVALLDRVYAASSSADRDQWCIDNWDSVTAHIGAIEHRTNGVASNLLLIGVALRQRLPKVLALFLDGLIDYRMARMIATRTANVLNPVAQRAIDAELALALQTWGPMSVHKTQQAIDDLISTHDPMALRRTQNRARSRSVDIEIDDGTGMANLFATTFTPNAVAVYQRLDALADTVCPKDPRTKDERRSDAMGVLGESDRLPCLCGDPGCLATLNPPTRGTIVYVVAHADTINGPAETPPTPTGPEPDAPDTTDGDDEPEPEDASEQTGLDATAKPDAAADSSTSHSATDAATDECAALDTVDPPRFSKPTSERTLSEALTPPPGTFATIRPGALMGGQFLPGAVTRRAALNATLVKIIHPGQTPPERHYAPSKKLADYVRCRDLTCRFPGCKQPATKCEVDHTIPWPYGPTAASNLKCLCRRHHLLKTFWIGAAGWQDRQLPDGTVVWKAPDGREHITTPGSRLLFPELCEPTAAVHATRVPPTYDTGLKMPRRNTTRAHDRLDRILEERELNRLDAEEAAAMRPS